MLFLSLPKKHILPQKQFWLHSLARRPCLSQSVSLGTTPKIEDNVGKIYKARLIIKHYRKINNNLLTNLMFTKHDL